MSAVPTVYSVLAGCPVDADISSLRFAVVGASPLPQAVRDGFESATGIRLVEGYGLTEATCVSALSFPHHPRPGSVGQRLPYQQMKAVQVNADGDWADLPAGQVGVLAISGPTVFPGYVTGRTPGGPVLGGLGKLRDGWLDTGDLAWVAPDGFVHLVGRAKDLIIRGGHNIDPAVIEGVLLAHPAVTAAQAVGRPDLHAGEVPVAFVTLAPGATATPRSCVPGPATTCQSRRQPPGRSPCWMHCPSPSWASRSSPPCAPRPPERPSPTRSATSPRSPASGQRSRTVRSSPWSVWPEAPPRRRSGSPRPFRHHLEIGTAMTTTSILAGLLVVAFAALGSAKLAAVPAMRAKAEHVGFSVAAYRRIGFLEVLAVLGLIVGAFVPVIEAWPQGLLMLLGGDRRAPAQRRRHPRDRPGRRAGSGDPLLPASRGRRPAMSRSQRTSVDPIPVVIVGAGPVGATAATLLGQYGVDCLVLDRWDGVYPQPRAVPSTTRSTGSWCDSGSPSSSPLSRSTRGLQLVDRNHRVFAAFDRAGDRGRHGHPQANMFDQPELEHLMRTNLKDQTTVSLRGNVEVTDVAQDGQGRVRVDLTDRLTGEHESVLATYVLGCDGANSVVRAAIGATMEDLKFEQRWLVVDVASMVELDQWEGFTRSATPTAQRPTCGSGTPATAGSSGCCRARPPLTSGPPKLCGRLSSVRGSRASRTTSSTWCASRSTPSGAAGRRLA